MRRTIGERRVESDRPEGPRQPSQEPGAARNHRRHDRLGGLQPLPEGRAEPRASRHKRRRLRETRVETHLNILGAIAVNIDRLERVTQPAIEQHPRRIAHGAHFVWFRLLLFARTRADGRIEVDLPHIHAAVLDRIVDPAVPDVGDRRDFGELALVWIGLDEPQVLARQLERVDDRTVFHHPPGANGQMSSDDPSTDDEGRVLSIDTRRIRRVDEFDGQQVVQLMAANQRAPDGGVDLLRRVQQLGEAAGVFPFRSEEHGISKPAPVARCPRNGLTGYA